MPLKIPAFINYDCQACGQCCRDYEIGLTREEYERLRKEDWRRRDREIDVESPFALTTARHAETEHCFALRPDGTCAFLASDARCIIHKHLGYRAKTLTCRLFPLTLAKTPIGWFAGARFNCRALAEGLGPPLERHRSDLDALCRELEASGRGIRFPDVVQFDDRQQLNWADYQKAERALINLLLRPDVPLLHRVVASWRVVDLMREAEMTTVGGARFDEFMQLISQGALHEVQEQGLPRRRPGLVVRWMFDQFLFHLHRRWGPAYRSLSLGGRLRMRLQGLGAALKFGTRSGRVRLFRDGGKLRLRDVSRVKLNEFDERGQAAVERYLAGKLFAKQIFGPLFYGYTFLRGFTALICAYGAVLWFARACALDDGRAGTNGDDITRAIQHVDFSFGHSPALMMRGEKLRMACLGQGDNPARIAMWQTRRT